MPLLVQRHLEVEEHTPRQSVQSLEVELILGSRLQTLRHPRSMKP